MKWFFTKETVRKAQCGNVPECGREFKKKGQSHYCGEKPKSIDEYILSQDEEKQEYLCYMRQILRSALPEAKERISWSMPTNRKGRNIVHFAASKKHIGLYPGLGLVEEFAEALKGYKADKGTIRAIAGLAGFTEINGMQHMLLTGFKSDIGSYGIGIAIMASANPIGVIFAALLFGTLQVGGTALGHSTDAPASVIDVMLGFVMLFVLMSFFVRRKLEIRKLKHQKLQKGEA